MYMCNVNFEEKIFKKNSLDATFQFKRTIFWTKFTQKGYFRSKTENMNNISIELCILELSRYQISPLTDYFDSLD